MLFCSECKDPGAIDSNNASLRQYIILQIGVYSMQKYPVQAGQYETEGIKFSFV